MGGHPRGVRRRPLPGAVRPAAVDHRRRGRRHPDPGLGGARRGARRHRPCRRVAHAGHRRARRRRRRGRRRAARPGRSRARRHGGRGQPGVGTPHRARCADRGRHRGGQRSDDSRGALAEPAGAADRLGLRGRPHGDSVPRVARVVRDRAGRAGGLGGRGRSARPARRTFAAPDHRHRQGRVGCRRPGAGSPGAGQRRRPRLHAVLRPGRERPEALRQGPGRRPAQCRPAVPHLPLAGTAGPGRRAAVLLAPTHRRARGHGGAGRPRRRHPHAPAGRVRHGRAERVRPGLRGRRRAARSIASSPAR